MISFLKSIFYFFYKIKMKREKVFIHNTAIINLKCKFEGKNKIYPNSKFINSTIQRGSYIGPESLIYNTSIGRYCSIGPRVRTVIGKHPSSKFVSTHPAFYSTSKQGGFSYVSTQKFNEYSYINPKENKAIQVGHDVWIGSDVIILEGVKIGNGAIIGSGALVNKNIEPYSIVLGVPAKETRKRFKVAQIDFLEKFKWWDRSEEWIQENIHHFHDIEEAYENFS